jgi:hypothetical protein
MAGPIYNPNVTSTYTISVGTGKTVKFQARFNSQLENTITVLRWDGTPMQNWNNKYPAGHPSDPNHSWEWENAEGVPRNLGLEGQYKAGGSTGSSPFLPDDVRLSTSGNVYTLGWDDDTQNTAGRDGDYDDAVLIVTFV